MSITASTGALLGLGALNAGSNILNQNNSWSESQGQAIEDSWGGGWSSGATASQAVSDAYSRVYGREASAEDILRAKEANMLQAEFLAQQQEYNSKEARLQRDWQEYMSNTAYQRAVRDLRAAGLNPILAAGNYGASTPGGGFASSGLQNAYKATTYPEQESRSNSSSWGSGTSSSAYSNGSHGESSNFSNSQSTTQLKDIINTIGNTFTGVSNAVVLNDKTTRDYVKDMNNNKNTTNEKSNVKDFTNAVRQIHK